MQSKNFKKFMATGLASVLCVGGMSIADLSHYSDNFVNTAYAATIKDTALSATGTIKSNVSIRKGPGTSYARLSTLKKGAKVTIVAKSSNGWYKIKNNNGYGYIYSDYVTINSQDNKDITYSAKGTINTNVYVRKTAKTSADKLGLLKKDATVTIVAKTSNAKWYKVKYKDGYGYIASKYITIKTNEDSKDIAYSATGVVNSNVYVRKTAKTSADKLGMLKKNTKVTIVAKSPTEAWYKVKYNGGYGYVSVKYITITSPEDKQEYPTNAVANHDVYVRKGGSPSAAKLGAITKGTKVTVLGKVQYNWYKIKYKDGVGYVYGEYLDVAPSTQK